MVNIFDYQDYRKFLKDIYDDRKKKSKKLSYRKLAQKVGFNSAGFFTNIITGKRGISPQIAQRFAEFFRLKIKEKEYFKMLVLANQAKKQTLKKYYLDKAITIKRIKFKIKDIDSHQFYTKWYYTAVRELLDIKPYKGDLRNLARSLYPSITPREAQKALDLLEELKLIKKNKNGVYQQTSDFITSGSEINSASLATFHMETADLAKRAIDKCPVSRRNISTLTLGLSEEGYETVVQRIREFRKELMQIARNEQKKDRIYHINFHMFPMSKKEMGHQP
jgi:uncharacterized protein (TIGR02147 family)